MGFDSLSVKINQPDRAGAEVSNFVSPQEHLTSALQVAERTGFGVYTEVHRSAEGVYYICPNQWEQAKHLATVDGNHSFFGDGTLSGIVSTQYGLPFLDTNTVRSKGYITQDGPNGSLVLKLGYVRNGKFGTPNYILREEVLYEIVKASEAMGLKVEYQDNNIVIKTGLGKLANMSADLDSLLNVEYRDGIMNGGVYQLAYNDELFREQRLAYEESVVQPNRSIDLYATQTNSPNHSLAFAELAKMPIEKYSTLDSLQDTSTIMEHGLDVRCHGKNVKALLRHTIDISNKKVKIECLTAGHDLKKEDVSTFEQDVFQAYLDAISYRWRDEYGDPTEYDVELVGNALNNGEHRVDNLTLQTGQGKDLLTEYRKQ
jgi:hypothetical protein